METEDQFFAQIFFFKLKYKLIYNTVLISGVQQSDSFIHIYILFQIFFSFLGYYKIMNIVSPLMCLIMSDLGS